MKILLGFLVLLPTIGFSQTILVDRKIILDNDISKITVRLSAIKSLPDYDNLIIGEHHYNGYGLKIFEKLVFPFQDVVATTDQTFYTYRNDTILTQEIKIHNAVRLTKKDDSYIGFFGIDYDSTIMEYDYFKNGLLKSQVEYSNTNKDTITKEYFYNNANQLIKLIQRNSSYRGKLHRDNFKELYYYSSKGRLDSIHWFPTGYSTHSTEFYKYDGKSNVIEKRKINGFVFETIVQDGETERVEIRQDPDKGSVEKNQYNKNGKLLRTERGFYSYKTIDVIDSYIYDKEDKLIEEFTESLSKDVIVIIGHKKYRYDKKGLLVAEEILKNKEIKFEYLVSSE